LLKHPRTNHYRSAVHHRAPAIAGTILGVATAAIYLIGSSRSFGYDAAATFANFVATPSIWDAFAVSTVLPTIPLKSVAGNDHVLLSLISHVIYSTTGSPSEVVYRLVPALAAGGVVGVTTAALSRRFGLIAGVAAGLFIATDPLFVDNSRDLRGYSLAALGCVLSTLILAGRWTRWRLIAYALLMGLAIAAQLFAGVALLMHLAWVVTRRSRPQLGQLAPAWVAAAVIGIAANANIQFMELAQHGYPASVFYPTFPRDLVLFLVGAPVLVPVGLWLATAGLGLWVLRAQPWLWAGLAVAALVVAVLWLGLQPAYLYPRFFVFLVPACALLMAAAIARWKVLAPVVVAGAVVAAISQAHGYTEDPLALPQAAAAVERIHDAGGQACVIHIDEQVLAAYTRDFSVVSTPEQLAGCTAVVVVSWNVDLALRDRAAAEFPRATALRAYYPGVLLER
jgi:hypothetical protein